MEIKRIRLTDLEQNKGQVPGLPSNPREWGRKELDDLIKSIRETPELLEARGLIVWPYGGKYIILGGNMRFSALREMNEVDAPCYVMPEDTPIEKLKEIVIKDNGAFGSWDYDMLANEWDDLPLCDWGVPAWDTKELEAVTPKEVTEDDFDEEKDHIEVRCRRGDVWQLGDHRLMCGDSVDLEDVKKLMGGAEADLWLTDPPYNVDYAEKEQYKIDLGYGVSKHEVSIANDKMGDGDFLEFLTGAFRSAREVMKAGAAFYIWHADSEGYNFRKAIREAGKLKETETLIWVKNSLCFGRQDYHWQHEPCLYGWKEGAGHKWYSDRKQTTILNYDKPRKSELHPTMKPVELFAYLVNNSTKPGDVILDSFGGSGTTLIVAEQTGRKARVMELEPHYCDVIIARWEKATGKEAILCEE